MNTDRWIKALLCVLVLVVLLFLFILLDLSWAGNRTLSLGEVWAALTGNGTWGTDQIVNSQNLPRIAIGVFPKVALRLHHRIDERTIEPAHPDDIPIRPRECGKKAQNGDRNEQKNGKHEKQAFHPL